jgi:hypothetical protein
VDDSGRNGTAALEGVKVSRLSSYLEGYRYFVCRDPEEIAEEECRREALLEDLLGWKPGSRSDNRYWRRVAWWREMAEDFLGELYSLRHATDAISQRYFDGGQVPFPVVAEEFIRLIGCLEGLVVEYNESSQETRSVRDGLEVAKSPNFIDTSALAEAVAPAARQHTAFLVDMAKAEALDAMGENQMALQLIDGHV